MEAKPLTPALELDEATSRDDGAIRRLAEEHGRFRAFLERRVGSRELAEEILQDAFVRSIERGDQLRASESATAWFYRLLRNALIDRARRRGTEQRGLEAAAHDPEAGHGMSEAPEAPDAALMNAVCGCVAGLVDTLKPEYADAIRRVELEGASVQDLAREATITPNNASVRVHRAREALRRQLARTCGACAEHGCLDCTCARK
jgi:RNA polymerase sigma-70 factor (ECF subfamily)